MTKILFFSKKWSFFTINQGFLKGLRQYHSIKWIWYSCSAYSIYHSYAKKLIFQIFFFDDFGLKTKVQKNTKKWPKKEIRFFTQGLMSELKKTNFISILVPRSRTRVRNQKFWFLTRGFIAKVYGNLKKFSGKVI